MCYSRNEAATDNRSYEGVIKIEATSEQQWDCLHMYIQYTAKYYDRHINDK